MGGGSKSEKRSTSHTFAYTQPSIAQTPPSSTALITNPSHPDQPHPSNAGQQNVCSNPCNLQQTQERAPTHHQPTSQRRRDSRCTAIPSGHDHHHMHRLGGRGSSTRLRRGAERPLDWRGLGAGQPVASHRLSRCSDRHSSKGAAGRSVVQPASDGVGHSRHQANVGGGTGGRRGGADPQQPTVCLARTTHTHRQAGRQAAMSGEARQGQMWRGKVHPQLPLPSSPHTQRCAAHSLQ